MALAGASLGVVLQAAGEAVYRIHVLRYRVCVPAALRTKPPFANSPVATIFSLVWGQIVQYN